MYLILDSSHVPDFEDEATPIFGSEICSWRLVDAYSSVLVWTIICSLVKFVFA